MKKRLEAELISIAHRVLKLKNKSEVDQLYLETQKLYEALSILKFYGDHIDQVKETISEADLEEKLANFLDNKSAKATPAKTEKEAEVVEEAQQLVTADEESEITETKVVAVEAKQEKPEEEPVIVGEINIDEEDDVEEEVVAESNESQEEEEKEEAGFDPIFEMASEKMEEETVAESNDNDQKSKTQQISFEHLLGEDYKEPEFVKPNDVVAATPAKTNKEEEEHSEILIDPSDSELAKRKKEAKGANLNEKFATGITIGLNDRIGFVKYLFDNSTEDYNRVLSQLNTFSTFGDAKEFIDEMVKPDYNNWKGQDDFAEKFMEIVQKKFA